MKLSKFVRNLKAQLVLFKRENTSRENQWKEVSRMETNGVEGISLFLIMQAKIIVAENQK